MLRTAIVAGIDPAAPPDLNELADLADAAGATVAGHVSKRGTPVSGTCFGSGTLEELASLVDETDADTVIVDRSLSPAETLAIEDAVGARVIDRHRLVLEIFAERARTKRAKHQVELARLKYELPRIERDGDPSRLNVILERGTRYHDVERRIKRLESELADLPPIEASRVEQRREQGFDLVALTGYTNAGKSTLLRQLADDMAVDEAPHPDLNVTAGTEDSLFKTLETTTRRATLDGRPILLTDTVGFLDNLPHWLVSSFRGTLEVATMADAVVLVVAADQPLDELQRKVNTSKETLGPECPPIVPALNKIDRVDEGRLERLLEFLREEVGEPVPISATQGEGLPRLREALVDVLPDLVSTTVELPLDDDGMSTLSWIYDRAPEADATYGEDVVTVTVNAKPDLLEEITAACKRARS